MLTGIFWVYSPSQIELETAVRQAAAEYRARFHREPSVCLVPPGAISSDTSRLGGIALRRSADLPPHHLWIGLDTEPPAPAFSIQPPVTFSRRLAFQPIAKQPRRPPRPARL